MSVSIREGWAKAAQGAVPAAWMGTLRFAAPYGLPASGKARV